MCRCPDCELLMDFVAKEEDAQEFDNRLDDDTDRLRGDLRTMSRENMEHDVDRLISAIDEDHILPEDF